MPPLIPLAAALRGAPAADADADDTHPPDASALPPGLLPSQERLRAIIDSVRSVVFQTDAQGRWLFLSRAWTDLSGRAVGEALGQPSLDHLHPQDREAARALFAPRTADDREPRRLTVRWLIQEGPERWVEVFACPVFDAEGHHAGTCGTLTDVTASRLAEHQLRLAASVFDNASEGIVITDPQARILDVNAAFCAITGHSREQVLGRTPALLASGRQDAAFYREMWRTLTETGQWSGEIWNRRRDGAVYAELLRITGVRGEDGQISHYVGIFTDITAHKRNQETLERLAHYDVLTGLPNRSLMLDRLDVLMRQVDRHAERPGERHGPLLAVCYLDLDGFQAVNDRWGHATGDALLLQAAERIHGLLRADDTVARPAGDEFILLLGDIGREADVQAITHRLLQALAAPYALTEAGRAITVELTTSIGVALYPDHGHTAEHLLRSAAQALFRAKRQGRNRVCWAARSDRAAREREALLASLRQALSAGELRLHYQPKVDARSRALCGAEALVRWQHPQHGLLGPGHFLPAIAGTPLERELDLWVLDAALAQLARWQQAGLDGVLCVNLSAASLIRPDLPARLAERIARHGAQARGRLELEVVETAALQDVPGAVQAMSACADLGVRFALDDFGTGYSSLAYLSQLPVQTLKIDQGFVRGMLDDASDMHIVKAIIGLARAFGIQTVAEGVETEAQAACLAALGCDVLQGFHIARGLPAEAFAEWAASHAAATAQPAGQAEGSWVI